MSLVEDMFKGGNIVTGLAIGMGAAVVAPLVVPVLRPLAKTVVKAGLFAYDQSRETLAELNEKTGDIIGEARSEMSRLASESGSDESPASQRSRRSQREASA